MLPFTSGGEPVLDYISDGISEEVRSSLSTIPGMRVIGRDSSSYYIDHTASTEEIGRALEVAWLLQGDFRSADDGIHATAQLLNTANSEVVWEEQFPVFQGNLDGLAQDIVRRIATFLEITGNDGAGLSLLLPMTTNPEAYSLYLEAQSRIWRGIPQEYSHAVSLLQTAVGLDPSFAEAHAVLADLYPISWLLDRQEEYNLGVRRDLARQSLQKALFLRPDSPLVLAAASKARYFNDDLKGALTLAERALRIDPNNTQAISALSLVQWKQKNLFASLQTSSRLLRLDPLSTFAMRANWTNLMMADRYQEALAVAERCLAFYPGSQYPRAYGWVAASKLKLGDRVGAIESSRKGMGYGPPVDLWTGLEYEREHLVDKSSFFMKHAVNLIFDEDYEQIRHILIDHFNASDPNSVKANSLHYLVNRGELEALAGNFGTSIEYFERAQLLAPEDEGGLVGLTGISSLTTPRQTHHSLALLFAYRKLGQHVKADETARQFENLVSKHRKTHATISELTQYEFLYKEAQYFAIEGRTVDAIDKLRSWVEHGIIFTYITRDPFFESMRRNYEFEIIVAEVEAELAEVRTEYFNYMATAAAPKAG